jgi:hypothetical protein
MKTLLITGILALVLCTGSISADPINVALGKPVTLNGVFPIFEHICDGPPPQASAATITDGVFLPNNTCWQLGTVYWSSEFSSGNSIEIDLQGTFQLDAAIVQADDNDAYQLQYRDPQGVYHDWWTVPQTCCFGMLTRPNQFDNTEPQSLPPVTATGLRIFGIDNQSDLLFSVSEVQVFGLENPPSLSVSVDIKPRSSPNSINPKSRGVIPVAILTTDTFDATTVDPLSVEFGPNGATEAHNKGHIKDVNHDGEPDLVLHFRTQETGIQCGQTSASLTGETFDGDPIQGSDAIKTVGCNKDR